MTTPTTKTTTALKVTSGIKAGGLRTVNHNRGLKVTSGIKAGGINVLNHNHSLIALA